MTLTVMDMLGDQYEFCCLIPAEGVLAEELKKRGIPYVLMGDQTLPTGVKGKSEIIRYGWMSVKNVWRSLAIIREFKPDILYAPGPAALPWSAVCGMLAKKPVVWHLHHIFRDGATKKLLNACGKLKAVKSILAVSNCVGDQIVNAKARMKMHVLYNPVDAEKYANGDASKVIREVETALGREIRQGWTLVVTQIAAITRNKRHDCFIHAISALKKMGMDVVGLMLGDAITKNDQAYKEQISSAIKELGLEKDIYMPGFRKDIPDFLDLSDCVLIPSSEEGLPLAGMEAMCARRRVVALDCGGAYELLSAAGCGTFYETGASDAVIANAVCRAMAEQCAEQIESGYRFGCEQSLPTFQKRFVSLMP